MGVSDVVTFGETMVRLSPPHHGRLEAAETLDLRIGGSESNTAIALTRLGRTVSWWSKLPDSPLGRRIASQVARWGVDTSGVLWAPDTRAGLYFVEFGASPRPHQVYYDRAGSAASTLAPEEVDWALLDGARHLHVTGITPALSLSCAATVRRAIDEARARRMTVSFDVNYRARLWPAEQAAPALAELAAGTDLLLCPAADAATLFGLTDTPEATADALRERFACPAVVVTAGGAGAFASAHGQRLAAAPLNVTEIDRVGAGDAFAAGVIDGFLAGDLANGLRLGMAMAALKHTMPGDELIATRAEIEAAAEGGATGIQR